MTPHPAAPPMTGEGFRLSTRQPFDFYPTPAECVYSLLNSLNPENLQSYPTADWCEPAAGNGAIIQAVNFWWRNKLTRHPRWAAVEIRPEPKEVLETIVKSPDRVFNQNFFDWNPPDKWHTFEDGQKFDVIITNPPFNQALDFVKRCLPMARTTIMLLPLAFMASDDRAEFNRQNPSKVFVLPKRPKFIGAGSDMRDVAWFMWRGPHDFNSQTQGKWEVLY